MLKQVVAFLCVCAECGAEWKALEVPKRCAKCKARSWNRDEAEPVHEVEVTPVEEEKQRRKEKKARRHAELKADCVGALPSLIPERMREKMNQPPLDHHPRCTCLRCRAHAGHAAAPPEGSALPVRRPARRLAAASTP